MHEVLDKKDTAERYHEARRLHMARRHREALAILEELHARHPGRDTFALSRALCLIPLGRHGEALALLEALSEGHRRRPDFLFARMLCHEALGRWGEALADCDRLLAEGDDPQAWSIRERILAGAALAGRTHPGGAAPAPKKRAARRILRLFLWMLPVPALAGLLAAGYVVRHLPKESPVMAAMPKPATPSVASPAPAVKTPEPVPEPSVEDWAEWLFPPELVLMPKVSAEVRIPLALTTPPLRMAGLDEAAEQMPEPAVEETPLPPLPEGQVPSVVELQPFRTESVLENGRGDRARLVNLNPFAGAWHVLETKFGGETRVFHLETPPVGESGERPALSLWSGGLAVTPPGGAPVNYPLWGDGVEVEDAALSAKPLLCEELRPGKGFPACFTPVCDGLVLVRSQKAGLAMTTETATDLLRRVPAGAWLVEQAKPFLIPGAEFATGTTSEGVALPLSPKGEAAPLPARLEASEAAQGCALPHLDIALEGAGAGAPEIHFGEWRRTLRHPGVWFSVARASGVEKGILESYPDRVLPPGKYDKGTDEARALVYLLAVDTDMYGLGYALGAQHPGVAWSSYCAFEPKNGGGPDGFGTVAPLSTVGAVPPHLADRVAAVFVGGFKREHGAFKFGPFAKVNQGTHFGYMESGVILSRPRPGLATVCMLRDGSVEMLTWPEPGAEAVLADGEGVTEARLISRTLHLRQNNPPVIDGVDENGLPVPGSLVRRWGEGAWSARQNGLFVTLRSALARQRAGGKTFLVFAYFTAATPNAMARVFQAYQCDYAMQLDMNSWSLCYSALRVFDGNGAPAGTEHVHRDMAKAEAKKGEARFVGSNDARDFFYLVRR